MYEFGRYRFDPENHLLESEGRPVPLTPKAFEILLVLVQNGSRLTTKEELMRKVWPDSFVEEANLTVNMSALRKQLGEAPGGQQYIATVPKKGYRFVVPVVWIQTGDLQAADPPARDLMTAGLPIVDRRVTDRRTEERPATTLLAIAGVPLAPAEDSAARIEAGARRTGWSRPVAALLLVAVLALCGVGYRAYRSRAVTSPGSRLPRRLAVLPFQNLRQDPDTDFLGFSLADAVISKLGYVRELTVRPSYAVQRYRAQTIDIPAVSASLDVNTLLTGTFLREGDDLRITCQLIDVKTQNLLWKGAFDVKYDRLLTVQDQVAQQIIRGLELTLSTSEAGRLKTEQAVSPLAYEYYLRGVDLYSKGDFPMAVKMLEKSTDLGPGFSLSWANLGRAYTANASFEFGGADHYRKAEAAFAKALSLQPDEIDAQIYLANLFTDTGRVEKAVPLLREALRTNPNHAEIHWELSYAYRFAGMLSESIAESERARELDPGVKLSSSTANGYLYAGRYDDFLRSLPQSDDVALIAFYRGLGEYYRKRPEEAAVHFAHAFELDRSLLQAEIGMAFNLGMQHQESKASAMLHSLEVRIAERGVVDAEAVYKIAQTYATIGDKASAIRVLRRSVENGFFPYPYLAADPLLDSLRGEEEFVALLGVARQRHQRFKSEFF